MTARMEDGEVRLPEWFRWMTGGFGAAILTLGLWAGTIQTKQNRLVEDVKTESEIKLEVLQIQSKMLQTLKSIDDDLKRIEQRQREHIKDFNQYKDSRRSE